MKNRRTDVFILSGGAACGKGARPAFSIRTARNSDPTLLPGVFCVGGSTALAEVIDGAPNPLMRESKSSTTLTNQRVRATSNLLALRQMTDYLARFCRFARSPVPLKACVISGSWSVN
jgi:hypothetical protein